MGTGLLFFAEYLLHEGVFVLQSIIFFPVSYLEDVLLALFILLTFTRLPKIMARRRTTSLRGIHYEDVVGKS